MGNRTGKRKLAVGEAVIGKTGDFICTHEGQELGKMDNDGK